MTMMDLNVGDVESVYGGPVGLIWELLAGKDSKADLDAPWERAGLDGTTRVLVLLAGPGGLARAITRKYGATVIGLVTIPQMVDEAVRRTEEAGLTGRTDFQQGNALDMPFHDGIFDGVRGRDAWCYVTDKDRMVSEVFRVLKPGGTLAFTDWVQVRASDDEWHTPDTFRIYPYFETIESYAGLLERNGFVVTDRGEVPGDPARQIREIRERLEHDHKEAVVGLFGEEAYEDALRGLGLWEKAAEQGLVGRGWLLARKP